MIGDVVLSIREAELEADAMVAKANENARAKNVAAGNDAAAIIEKAEEEAQAIRAKYRKMGDDFGRNKAAEILRIRKQEFSAQAEAARERIPMAVEFVLERIGTNGN